MLGIQPLGRYTLGQFPEDYPREIVPDAAFLFGGVGHYKLELERAKQLAAITRKAPPPVDLRTRPQFAPLASPPIAAAALAVDMAAVQQQQRRDRRRLLPLRPDRQLPHQFERRCDRAEKHFAPPL